MVLSLKHALLGPTYSNIRRVLAAKGSVDPRGVVELAHKALSQSAPSLIQSLAALAYVLKARHDYATRRASSISTHYDLPYAFFQLFLDRYYSAYSCAIFDDDSWTLEQAQRRKFEILVGKLDAKPGQRILDIGCGWGSFLVYASEVGLEAEGTALSQKQVAECQ